MRRRMSWTCALAMVGVFAVGPACGDDDGGGDSIPLNQVANSYLSMVCDVMMECDFAYAPLFRNTQDCVDFLATEEDVNEIDAMVQLVEQGQIDYDGAQAAECLGDWRAEGCNIFVVPEPDSCRDVFMGLEPIAGGCRMDEECESGWCDVRESCPGVCAQRVQVNEDCSQGEMCDHGLECVDGTCVVNPAPLGLGAPCDPLYQWCDFQYYCDQTTETCTARKPSGATCAYGEECSAGMMCIQEQCVVIQIVSTEGADCDPFEGIICDSLNEGLVCIMDFSTESFTTCTPAGQLGDTCLDQVNSEYIECDSFAKLYCDFQTGNCVSKKVAGQSCEDHDECLSDWCDSISGQCREEELQCWQM